MLKSSKVLGWLRHFEVLFDRIRRLVSPAEMVLFRDITAHWLQSAVGVAIELELAERLPVKGFVPLAELCAELDIQQESALRLLRVLTAHGYFSLSADESMLSHSRLSRTLQSCVAKDFARLQTSDWYRSSFSTRALSSSLADSVSAFEHVNGQGFFPHLLERPGR